MNSQDFVMIIRSVVRDSAVRSTLEVLEHPPGRTPSDGLINRSKWYHSLTTEDKQRLIEIVSDAVDNGVFGFLCVLDGVRSVESTSDKGRFELRYIREDTVLLNDPDKIMLHDLY